MKIKAVIFDLDGTLINSILDIAEAMNSALESLNFKKIKVEKYYDFIGNGLEKLVERVLNEANVENISEDLKKKAYLKFKKTYQEIMLRETKPYEAIEELLISLNKAKIEIGILSNKTHNEVVELAKTLFSKVKFFDLRGLKEDSPPKPDPTLALDMIKKLPFKASPQEIMYVGDSPVDILLAKNANFIPVGVSWGFRGIEELKESGALYILKSPLDLEDIIKQNYN